jgi:dTMP kinase
LLLRNVLTGKIEADQRTIAGLFLSDRFEHLLNKTDGIVKKLEDGFTVITDRYYFSSYAYHSVHVPMQWVIDANSLCAEILRPDLNVYVDISPEVSMQRIHHNRGATELYESAENLRIVREKYLEAFELLKDKEKVFVTDGNRAQELIAEDIWHTVKSLNK